MNNIMYQFLYIRQEQDEKLIFVQARNILVCKQGFTLTLIRSTLWKLHMIQCVYVCSYLIYCTLLHFINYSIDLVTGGPAPPPEPSPLDSMTDEAKEAEAEKLMGLINQLNR